MNTVEETVRLMKDLPDELQAEVRDFVKSLGASRDGKAVEQDRDWMNLSLSGAMRGMENEETPTYSASDLKEVFS
ncbi:hypothetical protein JXD38_08415 [candidate division WOR-3 bacterium]|nr:hypothetical protein [candidate division WOR-3 bacterium]